MLFEYIRVGKKNKFKALVFSNISTGAYGFPKDLASEISFETVNSFLKENDLPEKVVFCCYNLENLELYMNLLKKHI